MNFKIKELAKQAGFCLWNGEKHKPDGAVIDWSCEYDKELEAFYHLVVGATMQEMKFEEQRDY